MRTLLVLCVLGLLAGACSDSEADKACFEAVKHYTNALGGVDFRKTGYRDPAFDEVLAVAKKYETSSSVQCQALQKYAAAIQTNRAKPQPAPVAPPVEPKPAEPAASAPVNAPAPAPAPPAK